MIPGGTGGGGTGGGGTGSTPFPDPPPGDPSAITGAARSLGNAADDLEQAEGGLHGANAELEADWQGYAAALDHCQSEIKRLRHGWERAKHRQAANEALALKLTTSITATTKPDDATRVTTQANTASGQASDAGTDADHYALRAHTALTHFKDMASTYQSTLEGYSPGEAPGPFAAPFTAPGTPGRTFGLPSDGFPLPGDAHSLDPYDGVIAVGEPWNSPIPGYGVYKDATTPEVEPTDDLTNLVLLVSTLGGGPDHRDYSPLPAMRLSRKPQTAEIDPEFAELIAGLYYAFEDNLERCARLTRLYHDGAHASELHEEALDGARRIAYVERVVFEAMAHVIDIRSLPPGLLPMGVHSALARLAYALTALAEEDPEPEALLSQDDIHGLAHQYEIEEWVTRNREQNPDLKGGR